MPTLPVAREYLRVSRDMTGAEHSIAEQQADNQRAASRHGFTLGASYKDTGSASRYAKRGRDQFDQLLADLASDRYGAELLVLWESSRGSRRVREWVELVDLCEQRAVRIFVTSHGRYYDPANSRDRRGLLEDAVDSEYESAKSSARIRRAVASRAAQGRPHGKLPYGYQNVYDPATGVSDGRVPAPDTALIVQEIARRCLAGEALYSIAGDLHARGLKSPRGADWSANQVRRLAISPTYAGLRTHRGEVVGEGTWEPLVSLADHHALVAKLTDPARKSWVDGSVKHLLSGIITCGVCGARCNRIKNRGTPSYMCWGGAGRFCVSRRQAPVDALIEGLVIARLSQPDALALFQQRDDPYAAAAAEQARELRARLDGFYDSAGAGNITPTGLARIEGRLLPQIRDAERRAHAASAPAAVLTAVAGEQAATRWAELTMPQRREVVRALMRPRILRVPRRPRQFDPNGIDPGWIHE